MLRSPTASVHSTPVQHPKHWQCYRLLHIQLCYDIIARGCNKMPFLGRLRSQLVTTETKTLQNSSNHRHIFSGVFPFGNEFNWIILSLILNWSVMSDYSCKLSDLSCLWVRCVCVVWLPTDEIATVWVKKTLFSVLQQFGGKSESESRDDWFESKNKKQRTHKKTFNWNNKKQLP